jgi:biotin transport system substrate-specific component
LAQILITYFIKTSHKQHGIILHLIIYEAKNMIFHGSLSQPLRSVFWPTENKMIKEGLLIFLGIGLLAGASQLIIPLNPVPLTFQSAAVILLGMLYGSRLATISVIGYLMMGGLGLPLFAELSSGFGVFTGATAGYLLGFIPAAWLAGFLAERGLASKIHTAFFSSCLSVSIIFGLGVVVLSQFVGWNHAFSLGIAPFVLTEPLKLLAISLIIPHCWKKVC